MKNENTPPKESDVTNQETEVALDGATCCRFADAPQTSTAAYSIPPASWDSHHGNDHHRVVVAAKTCAGIERERNEARRIAAEACAILASNGFATNYPPMPWDDSPDNA